MRHRFFKGVCLDHNSAALSKTISAVSLGRKVTFWKSFLFFMGLDCKYGEKENNTPGHLDFLYEDCLRCHKARLWSFHGRSFLEYGPYRADHYTIAKGVSYSLIMGLAERAV